ncbi:MAG: ATP--guanido phosphotransferase [Defluviitaleaceae bacterium]|nr:ATP--guanido phosphotransferase [Defluviitaleaceae bacterium]
MKWYTPEDDTSPVISCRVRLARNFKKYNFLSKLQAPQAEEMVNEVGGILLGLKNTNFQFVDIMKKSNVEKLSLLEYHKISLDLLRGKQPRGLVSSADDTIHIMLNEEDHIRIQSIAPGKNIQKAYIAADHTDNLIEQKIEYAFDESLGYLTSCPSNTGTGMRASYMVHLPLLEKMGKLQNIVNSLSRAGMTMRGIYGESSDSIGSIYQISNQCSLGRSEEEIIGILENLTNQIVETEMETTQANIKRAPIYFEDQVYRALGVLQNCRQIDIKEARRMISVLRLGVVSGLIKNPADISIYTLMMNIEYGNLKLSMGVDLPDSEIDVARATYIRNVLNG